MNEHLLRAAEPFLRAIAERPTDALRWLVFAEWLDEAGFPAHAQSYRLQEAVCEHFIWGADRTDAFIRMSRQYLAGRPSHQLFNVLVWALGEFTATLNSGRTSR